MGRPPREGWRLCGEGGLVHQAGCSPKPGVLAKDKAASSRWEQKCPQSSETALETNITDAQGGVCSDLGNGDLESGKGRQGADKVRENTRRAQDQLRTEAAPAC